MRRQLMSGILLVSSFFIQNAYALLNLELTQGMAGAAPIGVASFTGSPLPPSQDIESVIKNDLKNSGRFNVHALNGQPLAKEYRTLGVDNIVTGSVQNTGHGYQVTFKLIDVYKGEATAAPAPSIEQKFTVSANELRPLAHHISDLIYEHILGVKGVFSTRLAYIIVQDAPTRYILEVCDQDGYNPHLLLSSTDPIMSPTWSPNGKELAYVSFENKRSAIYIQNIITGSRRLVSATSGINGAPNFSPDGKKLALVLSNNKSPNIYVMDLRTKQLTQLTHDYYINTEPSWSPDGRSLVFTSNRSGNPQIYQLNLADRSVKRLTYDGNYNARGSFTPDGNHLVMLNRESNVFNIGILDLDTGSFRPLTNSSNDNESPSIAPNGSMVLYGALSGGRSVLAMAATDGGVQVRLPARNGEVQDPAWSPFL